MTRNGNQVVAKLTAIRSRFNPDRIDAQVGDELTVHVTNVEQTRDMIHGFGLIEHNINMVMDPGETKTFHIKLTKPGVFPFYCTNFCSALHQEMQGYLVVSNAGQPLPGAVYRQRRRMRPAGRRNPRQPETSLIEARLTWSGLQRCAKLKIDMAEKYRICFGASFGFCTSRSISGRVCCCSRPQSTIAVSLFFPLWKMHLVAPQYSDGLDLYIFPYKIQGGGLNGQHLVEINNLNHYIGMKPIQAGGFHGDALDAVCFRSDHFDDAALGRVRRDEQRGRSFRRLLLTSASSRSARSGTGFTNTDTISIRTRRCTSSRSRRC